MTAQRMAYRVKFNEAKRAFENGRDIIVSEWGNEEYIGVTTSTTIHNRDTVEWDDLVEWVRMWKHRFPNQRYYIVEEND